MQVGIREFLWLPLNPDRLNEAVCRIADIRERKPPAFKSTDALLSFLPAKPGDDASTVALNVSSAIACLSQGKTLRTDFDLSLGIVSFLLKITNGYSVLNALDVVDGATTSVRATPKGSSISSTAMCMSGSRTGWTGAAGSERVEWSSGLMPGLSVWACINCAAP
jgi:hypothetical protein